MEMEIKLERTETQNYVIYRSFGAVFGSLSGLSQLTGLTNKQLRAGTVGDSLVPRIELLPLHQTSGPSIASGGCAKTVIRMRKSFAVTVGREFSERMHNLEVG